MPEDFQDDQTRSSEDADEAFERLLHSMISVTDQVEHIEANLLSAINSCKWACAWGPIRHEQIEVAKPSSRIGRCLARM